MTESADDQKSSDKSNFAQKPDTSYTLYPTETTVYKKIFNSISFLGNMVIMLQAEQTSVVLKPKYCF